ncbi:hypothetical protein Nepgr_026581 [Nepenthes gracilis]|uniref:Uncharacterized protein n=1 Tax=Nepenthes gracilis TaxID=150966 RepID=A0AAD3T7H3_NEPGR|nr:hypothetical protein Nepgr_026581 [Nepenthes gracilis]
MLPVDFLSRFRINVKLSENDLSTCDINCRHNPVVYLMNVVHVCCLMSLAAAVPQYRLMKMADWGINHPFLETMDLIRGINCRSRNKLSHFGLLSGKSYASCSENLSRGG